MFLQGHFGITNFSKALRGIPNRMNSGVLLNLFLMSLPFPELSCYLFSLNGYPNDCCIPLSRLSPQSSTMIYKALIQYLLSTDALSKISLWDLFGHRDEFVIHINIYENKYPHFTATLVSGLFSFIYL